MGRTDRDANDQASSSLTGDRGETREREEQSLLRPSLEIFRGAVDKSPNAVGFGQRGLIIYANASMRSLLKVADESELVGRPIAELIDRFVHPDDRSRLLTHVVDIVTSGQTQSAIPARILRRGAAGEVELTIVKLTSDGEAVYGLGARDVTEGNEATRAVRRGEAGFRHAIEGSPDAVLVHHGGVIRYVNQALLELLGYGSCGEIVGKPAISVVHPDDHAVVRARISVAAQPGHVNPLLEQRWVRKDGRAIAVEVRSQALIFDGEPAALAIARDVQERKELQARLMQADRMASVGTLASGVAHEINNPLSFVIANLGVLADELQKLARQLPAARELVDVLADAREGADRVRRIVRDLGAFSRPEEDKRGPVDIVRVLEWSINMTWTQIRHRARLVKDYGAVPFVDSNEFRLSEVFVNLLVNAAQAIPEGNVAKNEIRLLTRLDNSGRVVVEVRDSGSGIPREIRNRIFEPFFTTKSVGVGTGLGLSICHGIVTQLGGEISVDSELGKGSTFRVILPAAHGLPAEAALSEPKAPPARRGRVLVVDDELLVGTSVQRALASEHDVVIVSSGQGALERLSAHEHFDVILCDLMMPEMTGMDLHAELRKRWPQLSERLVFITGGTFTPGAREFLERVANQRLEKPFDMEDLRVLIRDRIS
jgi:PAS domain S-box-containing protein